MGKRGDPLLLIWLKPEMNRNRDKSDSDQNDANQIPQRQPSDEPQRQEHRNPNDNLAKIGLQQDEQAGCSRNRSGE